MNGRVLPALLALTAGLAGCGLKGPLYLPEKSRDVIIRPAPSAAAEAPTAAEPPPTAEPAVEPAGEPGAAPDAPTGREAPPSGTGHG